MNSILFLIGDFLPTKSGGTIRLEKLIKYLPDSKWKKVILTRRVEGTVPFEIINSNRIYRSKCYDITKIYHFVIGKFSKTKNTKSHKPSNSISQNGRLADKWLVPDVHIFWAIFSIKKFHRIINNEKIQVIYSTSPQPSVHLITLLHNFFYKTKIPWIVEFRDPWIFNPFRSKKNRLLEALDNFLEKNVLKHATKVIVTSEIYKEEFLKKYSFLNSEKVFYVPNGYDSEDFTEIIKYPKNSDKISIIHAGNFYGQRTVRPFLEAIFNIFQNYPNAKEKMEFVQYGSLDPIGEDFIIKNPNPMVKVRNFIPHNESLKRMVNADWLLLVPGPGKGTMSGKFYEYLASEVPILALVDEGSVREIIQNNDCGIVLMPDDVAKIYLILTKILHSQITVHDLKIGRNKFEIFDRKNIAVRISKIIENALHC